MTRPLTGERIDQTSSGVIEHGALSTCVELVGLISIFDAAVEGRLSENLFSVKKYQVDCITKYVAYFLIRASFRFLSRLFIRLY